jgi:hypothetical protein
MERKQEMPSRTDERNASLGKVCIGHLQGPRAHDMAGVGVEALDDAQAVGIVVGDEDSEGERSGHTSITPLPQASKPHPEEYLPEDRHSPLRTESALTALSELQALSG